MAERRPPEDIRKREDRSGPRTGAGDGAAYKGGYGAGGLGSGEHQRISGGAPKQNADCWDAPGVTPEGRRTGTPTNGPRIAMDEESEPKPPGDERA